jgi:hypothetical protein
MCERSRRYLPIQDQKKMAGKFDITPAMAPFLDVHMVLPLLDFLREVGFNKN